MVSDSATEPAKSEPMRCSRRAFLAGTATIAAGAMASTPVAGESPSRGDDWPEEFVVNPTDDTSRFGQPGEISREGYRLLAEAEYQAQQKGQLPKFDKRVDAVKDLGLDPNGKKPVQDKLASAAEPGMLVVCPQGSEFRVTGNLLVDVDGPFGMVGEGYKKSKRPPGPNDKNGVIFTIDNSGPTVVNFRTPSGLFANFALDQRGPQQMVAMRLTTDGYILAQDLRTIGPHSSGYSKGTQGAGPALAPETSKGATVRVNRYTNVGGGKSGTKNSGGMPIVWVGAGHNGTVQLIDCHIENSPDNGLYGGRSPGNAEVYGGLWRNNDVSQIRTSGKGSRVDAATVVLDEQNYKGAGSKQGFPSSNGIKWDGKISADYGAAGGTIVNCDIRGLSEAGDEYGVGSLIAVFDTAGAATIKNTRLVSKIADAIPISAQSPAGGVPQPHRIITKNSVIGDTGDGGAITISGRPRSLVEKVCLKYSGASPSDIQGAGTSGVSYGKQCGNVGLKNPKKVGSPGKLPPIPELPGGPGSGKPGPPGSGGGGGRKRKKTIFTVVTSGIFMLLFLVFGTFVVFVMGGMALLGGLVALLGGD